MRFQLAVAAYCSWLQLEKKCLPGCEPRTKLILGKQNTKYNMHDPLDKQLPGAGTHLTLEGIGAYDAAVHCASVAAVERSKCTKKRRGMRRTQRHSPYRTGTPALAAHQVRGLAYTTATFPCTSGRLTYTRSSTAASIVAHSVETPSSVYETCCSRSVAANPQVSCKSSTTLVRLHWYVTQFAS